MTAKAASARQQISVRISPNDDLVDRVDEWISRQKLRPSRSDAVRFLIERGLEKEAEEDGDKKSK